MFSAITVVIIGVTLFLHSEARKCPIGQRFLNGTCTKHCYQQCRGIDLPCDPFLINPLTSSDLSSWEAAENIPCFQRERDQITGETFLRTSCRCPERVYTNTSNPGTLSNCILTEITEEQLEINFGQLSWVQIGAIRALGEDIDFQGNVKRSNICVAYTAEDVEFGTMTKFSYNTVNTMIIGDDLQFEPGVVVGPFNEFKNVQIDDEFRFVDDQPEAEVKVIRNIWNILTADECDIESETQPRITGNICNATDIDDMPSCLIPQIADGFSCLG